MFHTLKSFQSLNSVTDLAELLRKACDPNLTCGRTKATAIMRGVLSPHAKDKLMSELSLAKFVTIHFDCSNRGNVKLLSVLVRFFSFTCGPVTRVLDVHSVPGETAEILAKFLMISIEKWNLKSKVIALCADNASTNFGGVTRGGDNNVLMRVKEQLSSQSIFGIGCLCHIVNNCISNCMSKFIPCNISGILATLHLHFKGCTVRCDRFKQICLNWTDENGHKKRINPILPGSFSKTRWLSLFPALETLVKMWPQYKSYFDTFTLKASDSASLKSKIEWIKSFFNDQKNYLWCLTIRDIAIFFYNTVEAIESDSCSIIDGINEIKKLNMQLLSDKLYSNSTNTYEDIYLNDEVREVVDNWSESDRKQFKEPIDTFYEEAAKYLSLWIDYTEEINELQLNWFELEKPVESFHFKQSLDALARKNLVERIGINRADIEKEFSIIQPYINERFTQWNELDSKNNSTETHERWIDVINHFETLHHLPNVERLVEYVLSLPGHNASVERIFSKIKFYWSDCKSNLSIDHLNDFLYPVCNLDASNSTEMYEYLLKEPELCLAIKSDKKYRKKRKPPNVTSNDETQSESEETEPINVNEPTRRVLGTLTNAENQIESTFVSPVRVSGVLVSRKRSFVAVNSEFDADSNEEECILIDEELDPNLVLYSNIDS